MNVIYMKVANKTNPGTLAGAIANTFREVRESGGDVTEHVIVATAIGAGAVNQTVKAYIIAKGYVAPSNLSLRCEPGFKDLRVEDEERTAIEFYITARLAK